MWFKTVFSGHLEVLLNTFFMGPGPEWDASMGPAPESLGLYEDLSRTFKGPGAPAAALQRQLF